MIIVLIGKTLKGVTLTLPSSEADEFVRQHDLNPPKV